MARRRKGNPIHGWLVLDKPTGVTSTRALAIAKRLFNAQKAGHAGTLDPLATGILPIAFGEATKTASYAVDGTKSYRFGVKWGTETNTDDCEGVVTETSDQRPEEHNIRALLPDFIGDLDQVPPAFSALKINGERAYNIARKGGEVALAPRTVTIGALALVEMVSPDVAVFEVTCGKGTYVRALARDIGRQLGCLGHVSELRRTEVGDFSETEAISLEALEALQQEGGIDAMCAQLKPVEAALSDFTEVRVDPRDAARLASGQPILIRGQHIFAPETPVYAISKGRIIALGEVAKGELRPLRVFNYAT